NCEHDHNGNQEFSSRNPMHEVPPTMFGLCDRWHAFPDRAPGSLSEMLFPLWGDRQLRVPASSRIAVLTSIAHLQSPAQFVRAVTPIRDSDHGERMDHRHTIRLDHKARRLPPQALGEGHVTT